MDAAPSQTMFGEGDPQHAHHHHHGVDLASRPQIMGDVNTGHIVGHLVPGIALFIAGCCLTHIVCSELIARKAYTYSSLGQDATGKESNGLVGRHDEEQPQESVFLFYHHGPRYEERPTDLFKLRLGVLAVIFLAIGVLLEGYGGVYAGLGFFYQLEHIVIYLTYLPFAVCLILESGKVKSRMEFTRYSPLASQFFLTVAFFANYLIWLSHLKMKVPGWDYDGHETLVIICKGATLCGIAFIAASIADNRKLANSLYLLTPFLGLVFNGTWLLTHAFVLSVVDVTDKNGRIQEMGYPLFVVEMFVVAALYLLYLRRRYNQVYQ